MEMCITNFLTYLKGMLCSDCLNYAHFDVEICFVPSPLSLIYKSVSLVVCQSKNVQLFRQNAYSFTIVT